MSIDNNEASRMTKRARMIEEKVKNKQIISLFDTDGDLSRHNIIEGGRRTRQKSEPLKRKKPRIIKNAKEKLLTKDPAKNKCISSKLLKMEQLQKQHENSVKELYHLELFQNMLDYNPTSFINDIRFNKYVQEHDLWEGLTETIQDPNLIDLLQSAILESNHIPNQHQLVQTINTGTGLKRQNRQFLSLQDYLDSFYTVDELDDCTPEAREEYIQNESLIRQRLIALERQGGFSTRLKTIANRKPEQPPTKHPNLLYDRLLTDMSTVSKTMQLYTKQKRSIARKCAKAIDKYWENIKTQDERAEKEETRRLQRLAKHVSNHVKRKWKLIERICDARLKEVVKEKQAQEGRRHLELILEHSEHVLGLRKEELRVQQDIYSDSDQEDIRDHIISDDESDDDELALKQLEQDQNLTVEELIQKYQQVQTPSDTEESIQEDDEFSMVSEQEDVPIEEDGETEDDDEELNALQEDADLSVEELINKYRKRSPSIESIEEHDMKRIKVEDRMQKAVVVVERQGDGTPFLLRGTLREYQRVGLDWLASLYNNGLNGILADEMGLGKTIQTISLLAYLACEKQVWGPHLVVVPTSVILNWEMEFKKWLPGFKIMTYYGTPKERRDKRTGWSKENAFHVCITSYQLVLQDQNAFRRKQWHYLILDEAHHIKNFRSQRWQVLLNFNAKRRLLLTGTPLQNNLIELWSLLYFLMPNGVSQDMPIGFANLKEFQEWFSNPVDRMIENQDGIDEESRNAIQKLHTVLRPYLLRRLKSDVEKQLPEKHEHVVYCRLSKRQRFLYDDFMSRAKTKETLASGNFLNIINCLMQLRKVCNHPDLFEERPILTSFGMVGDVQYAGQTLEHVVRKKLWWGKHGSHDDRDKVDLGFLNLVFTDTQRNKIFSQSVADDTIRLDASKEMLKTIAHYQKRIMVAESRGVMSKNYHDLRKYAKHQELQMHMEAVDKWQMIMYVNRFRCARRPIYDTNLIHLLKCEQPIYCFETMQHVVQGYKHRIHQNKNLIEQFGFVTPKAVIRKDIPSYQVQQQQQQLPLSTDAQLQLITATNVENDIFHPIVSRLSIAFPDKRLLQYDCGKLQKLDILMRELVAGGHRALIFTQMTRVLDILETFLNMHGYRYLRLDGATKVEQRQVLTEHFNNDKRITCFILSTRSGGLGINLTGADTVIFYDSDWNPSMDKQCQDRAHRIGQTRDVHIYRFVTEYTIEENIFKKANQKRMLDNVVIQEGEFTEDYFNKNEWWKDLPEVVGSSNGISNNNNNKSIDYEQALLQAEDESDAAAAIAARKEMNMDENEFEEQNTPKRQMSEVSMSPSHHTDSPLPMNDPSEIDDEDDMQLDVGHVDQYMLQFWEREVVGEDLGFGGFT